MAMLSFRRPRSNSAATSAFQPREIMINRLGKYIYYIIQAVAAFERKKNNNKKNYAKTKPLLLSDVINPLPSQQPPHHHTRPVNRNKLKSCGFPQQNVVRYTYGIVELGFIVLKCVVQSKSSSTLSFIFILIIRLFKF